MTQVAAEGRSMLSVPGPDYLHAQEKQKAEDFPERAGFVRDASTRNRAVKTMSEMTRSLNESAGAPARNGPEKWGAKETGNMLDTYA